MTAGSGGRRGTFTISTPCIRKGYSRSGDPACAAEDLYHALHDPTAVLSVVFCSAEYDLATLGRELAQRFDGTPLIGCTSAGEISPAGYLNGAITGFSLCSPEFKAVAAPIRDVTRCTLSGGTGIVRSLRSRLLGSGDSGEEETAFAFLMIDGLCRCEELVVSAVHAALGGLPLFGGSAGGDIAFTRSFVLWDGQFLTDAAVLALVSTTRPVKLFTTDHFVSSEKKMVVTEADTSRRIVSEINGEPAAREYARMFGLNPNPLTPMIFATHPVVVRVGGRYYTRSIQKVNTDESLTFFCAIDRGIVLTVAESTDIFTNLVELFSEIEAEIGSPDLVIGCDCVLRSLELEQRQLKTQVGRLLMENNVIGFGTFGEQFQAMHVNQTFTGAAIGFDAQASERRIP